MCLVLQTKRNGRGHYYVDKSKAMNPKIKAKTEGWKVVGKMYCDYQGREINELRSPFKRTHWKPGVVESNRPQTALTSGEKAMEQVNLGIHLFFSEKAARAWASFSEIVLRVEVDPKDFVACNTVSQEAVYQKVTVTQEDYDKAMRLAFPSSFREVGVKVTDRNGQSLSFAAALAMVTT